LEERFGWKEPSAEMEEMERISTPDPFHLLHLLNPFHLFHPFHLPNPASTKNGVASEPPKSTRKSTT